MKKKKFDYFETLTKMSEYALQEAELLEKVILNFDYNNLKNIKNEMHELEHSCDIIKHDLTTALVKDFLPPIERDDLFRLSHVTDNLTDSIDDVTSYMYMADIKEIRSDAKTFSELIIESCRLVVETLREFKNFKKPEKLKELIIKINDIEEKGDYVFGEAMHNLSSESNSVREIIEWRDVYNKLERCLDMAESIADNVESIILKNS